MVTRSYAVNGPPRPSSILLQTIPWCLGIRPGSVVWGLCEIKSYKLKVIANDGKGGSATQNLTVEIVDETARQSGYDRLTLDWDTDETGTNRIGFWGRDCITR